MGRARSKNPKRNGLYLRLTDQQLELLKKYTAYREFMTEVDAIRAMIDGLEDWFRRQEAKRSSAGTSTQHVEAQADSGLPRVNDVRNFSGPIDAPLDASGGDEETSVGDFGGRPSVGLPESRHDGME